MTLAAARDAGAAYAQREKEGKAGVAAARAIYERYAAEEQLKKNARVLERNNSAAAAAVARTVQLDRALEAEGLPAFAKLRSDYGE
jgi:hypothetical protein